MAKLVDVLVQKVLRKTPTKAGETAVTKTAFVQNVWQDVILDAKPSTFDAKNWKDAKLPYAEVHFVFDLSNVGGGNTFEIELRRKVDGTNYRRHSLVNINNVQSIPDLEMVATCTSAMLLHARIRQTDALGSVDVPVRYWAVGGAQL